jgi:hypothetical protein
MNDKQAKDKRKGKPGRPPSHGGYSFIIRAGELPERRTYIRAYLQAARDGLIEDLGPREEDLTTAQRVLVDRAISKLSVVRCIEEHVKEEGVFRGRELSPVMGKNYITYCESIRRDLEALGISKRAGERVLSPLEIAAEIDAGKAKDAVGAAQEGPPQDAKDGRSGAAEGPGQGSEAGEEGKP